MTQIHKIKTFASLVCFNELTKESRFRLNPK